MTISTSTQVKAASVFEKFCDRLSKVEMKHAVLVPAAIGVTIAMFGVFQEAQGQSALLHQGGMQAIEAYKAALEPVMNFTDLIKMGFSGKADTFGGNSQGIGAGVTIAGPVLAMSTVMLAKAFQNVKQYVSAEVEKIRDSQKSKNEMKLANTSPSDQQNGLAKMRQIYANVLDRKTSSTHHHFEKKEPTLDDDENNNVSPAPGY